MLNEMGAGFVLRASDAATPVIKKVGAGFAWLKDKAGNMAGGLNASLSATAIGFGALHAGLGIIHLAEQASEAAGSFKKGLIGVGLISRATAVDLKKYHDATIAATIGTEFSPDQAIEGLRVLVENGVRATDSQIALRAALDLTTGSMGQLGLAQSADVLADAIDGMNQEMSQAGTVTDQLLRITQMSEYQARDFEGSISKLSVTAKDYNQTFSDILVNMGLMRNRNIGAEKATMALAEAYRNLATDQQGQAEMQKLGISVFDPHTKKMRSALSIMAELAVKTKDLSDQERMRIRTVVFGFRGVGAYNAVSEASFKVMSKNREITLKGIDAVNAMRYSMSQNGDVLDKQQTASLKAALGVQNLGEVLSTSTHVAQQFRDALADTYGGQKQLIGAAWQTLLTLLGEDFTKSLKPAVKVLYELLTSITAFVQSMSPEAKQTVFKFVVAIGGLLVAGGGLMLVSGAIGMLGGSIIGLVVSIGKLLLIGTPIVMLLSGMGIGFTALFKSMKVFGDKGMDISVIMEKVRLAASGAMSILTGEAFSEDLQKNLDKAENQGIVKFLKSFERWIERLKSFWTGLKSGFESGIAALSESSAFGRFKDKLESIISVFTGGDAQNSSDLLNQWKEKGAAAGSELARLGETAASVMENLIQFGSDFATFIGNLTAEDLRGGVATFVDAFRQLYYFLADTKTVLDSVYYTVKMLLAAIFEGVDLIRNVLSAPIDIVWSGLTGTKKEFQDTLDYFKDSLSPENAFSFTAGAATDLADVYANKAERDAQRESDLADAATRERRKGMNRPRESVQIGDLEARKRSIEDWINTSAEDFRARNKGTAAEGNLPFSEASQGMQQQFLSELQSITKQLEKMSGQPVTINVDGDKLAQVVGRQPSMTGEDSLDDTAAVPAF